METKQSILETKYFDVPNITDLKDLLYQSAKKYKDKVAFVLKDKVTEKLYEITYSKLKEDVLSLGTSLIKLGLKGKAISVVGKNSYSWMVSYIASSIIGIVVPIDRELHVDDMINFINSSESHAVIADYRYLKAIIDNKEKINHDIKYIHMNDTLLSQSDEIITMDDLLQKGLTDIKNGDTSFDDIKINPDDMHILLFTSGTTGNAKGICLSHKNICSNIMSVAKIVKVDSTTTVLSILPIHHTYECTLGQSLILYGGGTITYCDGLRHISKNINEYKPSFIICVPLLLENVHKKIVKTLQKSLPKKYFNNDNHFMDNMPRFLRPIVKYKVKKSLGGNVRTFIVGAAAIDPTLVESFFKLGFKTLQGYGLTECSPLVAGNNDFFHKYDAVGLPIPEVEYKINNPDNQGIGEIIVKGPNVMLGYYNNPEETNKVLKDGWFYTGDSGYIDNDGYLYITGRLKSVIVTKNGKNIYPEELEYHLNSNPLVAESIIIGVKSKSNDETFVNAKILPDIDAIKEHLHQETLQEKEIYEEIKHIVYEVNKKLPNYKHIKNFKVIDEELEKTTTKKIKRFGNNLIV